ncbi:helix-turn-helix domain-containing protein [Acetobacterium woodii]|uniref:helix-turn-helix domain-containing protein n=1 Tax=Acetobacterium woodii TaxID=33952 RepID=UPI0002DC95BB|nr:helix-turn-helix domain-containing protein [Acetobacterium woodii]
MEDKLYTVADAAKILGCSKPIVYELINKGLLRALKLGHLKIRRITLESFMANYDGMDLTDMNNIKPYLPENQVAS